MSSPKISEQEKRILRENAKKELERMEECLSDQSTVQILDSFKNKFNICETVYKVILKEHQKRKGKSVTNFLMVDMRQVPNALKFAGYDFDKELLIELFGSSSQKGETVKKLRDKITHGIDETAAEEIITRKDELFGYMDKFLTEIRLFNNITSHE